LSRLAAIIASAAFSGEHGQHRRQPACQRRQKVAIAEQFARRIAAAAVAMQEIEVAQRAVEDEGHGRHQVGRAVLHDRLGLTV